MQAKYEYEQKLRVGAAGGISTPASAAAAFSMGVAYIVTGSVNQACVESGTSDIVRQMLAETQQADVTMAPAADMFEMGVKVQVLKRGTMFAMRGAKLYELYRKYDRIEDIPAVEREILEKNFFRNTIETVWEQTRQYFLERDAGQVDRANREPKHKMALIFRSYLGQASHWANSGVSSRKIDYQVWCGPAMGAFNEWVTGSFLEQPENRRVVTVALNILYGAGVVNRLNGLRMQGVQLPSDFTGIPPLTQGELNSRLQ
jgi:PfaD family protein